MMAHRPLASWVLQVGDIPVFPRCRAVAQRGTRTPGLLAAHVYLPELSILLGVGPGGPS